MTIRNRKPNLLRVPPNVIVPDPGMDIFLERVFSERVGLLELKSAIFD